MQRILIAGCGYVGGALAAELSTAGHEVWALRRTPGQGLDGVTSLEADLTQPGAERRLASVLPEALDAVVFAAAPDARNEEAYRRLYVDGLAALIGALRTRRGAGRLLFTSSTAVYAQSAGEWVDEASPAEAKRWNGRVMLEAERLVRAAPFEGCVLRLGGIYGPGRTRLLEQVRSGTAVVRSGRPQYTNRIHRDDAAGALHHLIQLERVDPLYLGVDARPADEREVLFFLADLLQVPRPPVVSPADATERRAGSKRCRSRRLVDSGYRLRVPSYREGYTQLVEDQPPAAPAARTLSRPARSE